MQSNNLAKQGERPLSSKNKRHPYRFVFAHEGQTSTALRRLKSISSDDSALTVLPEAPVNPDLRVAAAFCSSSEVSRNTLLVGSVAQESA
jgi:hypothetical protein